MTKSRAVLFAITHYSTFMLFLRWKKSNEYGVTLDTMFNENHSWREREMAHSKVRVRWLFPPVQEDSTWSLRGISEILGSEVGIIDRPFQFDFLESWISTAFVWMTKRLLEVKYDIFRQLHTQPVNAGVDFVPKTLLFPRFWPLKTEYMKREKMWYWGGLLTVTGITLTVLSWMESTMLISSNRLSGTFGSASMAYSSDKAYK